ncbi:amidohydrolase family protein [Bosea sp. 124]|uniref:amidohydrolase family protein n=1 Tax=Bosea sp. 124 TaxID=2135642 RepID=UPI000D352249|nr:amidohydrolase family protein [Bosea sp. 124]PTM39837.1 D-galactarolactone isomerase [Bosea sp. 124]
MMHSLVPRGACDCHVHIFDPAHPLPGRPPRETPDATLAAYRAVQHATGLERVILVQANGYGSDNRCMLEALAALGKSTARGVAVVAPDAPRELLVELDAQGVCGIRFHLLPGGLLGREALPRLSRLAADLGWHVQVQCDGRLLAEHAELLAGLPCPIVIDHIGKFLEPVPVSHTGFVSLLSLLERGDVWVKLSAPYEVSRSGPPDYADVSVLARALADAAPERMVWASNWPHPWFASPPSEAALIALLAAWVPDESRRRAILVDNPARLYGFDAG